MIRDERGMILIVTIHLLAILLFIGAAAVTLTRIDLKISGNHKNHTKAFWTAEAAIEYARITYVSSTLDDGNVFTWDSSGLLYPSATGLVTITPDGVDPDVALISSTATYRDSTSTIEVGVKRNKPGFQGILGGVTSNGPIAVNGTLEIDGREHDINCNLIGGAGVPGIYTNSTFDQSGNGEVGGHESGTDYVPSNPGDPAVITENGTDAFSTPDGTLGLEEGILKYLAQSGIAGSQYVTDPDNLTLPLQGITYVELPSGAVWQSANMLTDGSGILVVHNSTTDAVLENTNGGTFTGLVITDDIVHLHNQIIGALVTLTANPSSGNVLGNGTGSVCYSSQVFNGIAFLETIDKTDWKEDM